MATRSQVHRLAQRIDELATRFVPSDEPVPIEHWVVEGDRAWRLGIPEEVISVAELRARPPKRASYPTQIIQRIVHAKDGRPAECCQPGGACYALHGPNRGG